MKIRFGPAGNSESFYAEGFKHTNQAPAWLKAKGLSAFEYSFGRGVSLGEATAARIAQEAAAYDIALSVHAPYFINLAVTDDERRQKNFSYFLESARAASALGAKRMVFHPGAASGGDREEAMRIALAFFKEIIAVLDDAGLGGIALCPETMGKLNQLGDVAETIRFCNVDERVIPAIDFAHLHARSMGGIHGKSDYADIIDAFENGVGAERTRIMHVHFSRIEYTKQGEKKHRTFAETEYGPEFGPLAELVAERGMTPNFICESKGTMAEDAVMMKKTYEEAIGRIRE